MEQTPDPPVFSRFQQLSVERTQETTRKVPILQIQQVVKRYGSHTVIPPMTLQVEDIEGKAEIISILGPSGCGKSTILKLIAGLEPPSEGTLFCSGNEIKGPGMDRGMIFQKYSSFPFLTILDNIAYPLIHVQKLSRNDARDIAMQWVSRMHLLGSEAKYPHQLSGGMQQRVAIARSLAMNAKILLMDEPFGALDRKIRWEMQDLIAELAFLKPAHEFTILLVTHDIPEAVYLGDRVWIMHKGTIAHSEFCARPVEPARSAQNRREFLETVSWFSEKIDSLSL